MQLNGFSPVCVREWVSVIVSGVIVRVRIGEGHTQFATIGKRLPTVCTFIRLLSPVASFVSVQGGLSGEYLAADGASEVFIYAS